MLDWPFIQQQFNSIITELTDIESLSKWHIQPQSLQSTNHKTKYGMADINGVVYINEAFVGTTAYQLLDVTIRHELAHLCVGLQHGHDFTFKAKAAQFKAIFGRHLEQDSKQVHEAIGYKYHLYATLEDGQQLLFRRVHRKHTKYLNYKPGRFKYLTIRGKKVLSFNYSEKAFSK